MFILCDFLPDFILITSFSSLKHQRMFFLHSLHLFLHRSLAPSMLHLPSPSEHPMARTPLPGHGSQRSWAAPGMGNWLSCDYNPALNADGKQFPALQTPLISHPLPRVAGLPLPCSSLQGECGPIPMQGDAVWGEQSPAGSCGRGAKPAPL